jgi:tripartite ATP-independent transporter DctM subunit
VDLNKAVDLKKNDKKEVLLRIEDGINYISLFLLALIPAVEVFLRTFFGTGIPDSSSYVYHLVFFLTFIGGALTAKQGRHLAIVVGNEHLPQRLREPVNIVNGHLSIAIVTAMFWSSLSFVLMAFDGSARVGILPIRWIVLFMPLGLLSIAWRFFRYGFSGTPEKIGMPGKIMTALGALTGSVLAYSSIYNLAFFFLPGLPLWLDDLLNFWYVWIPGVALAGIILLIVSAVLGNPLFVVLGGLAYLLFARNGGALESIPNEAYTMLISETIPVIPLFTLAGFILSASNAGERLVRLFHGFFGWVPGGQIIAAVLVSTFFTTFTGASGVTILALGGILYVVLHTEGPFTDRFTTGFLTASGSVGFLFPPSLTIILYAVVARISVIDMFIGAFIPGVIVMVTMMLIGIFVAWRNKVPASPLNLKEVRQGLRGSVWELVLPLFIIVMYFSGTTTLLETASLSVIYVVLVEVLIHHEVKFRELPGIALKAMPIIGGVLIILAMSRGLSYYIIDARVPGMLTDWIHANIQSKFVFLVLLNIALIITGCFMDIFSAIMVVAPLVIPMGQVFGVDPVHLGIIFLANLELGFMTPPVGLNLFLSSYRFEKPLSQIYVDVIPFFFLQLIALLVITYVPWLTTVLLRIL